MDHIEQVLIGRIHPARVVAIRDLQGQIGVPRQGHGSAQANTNFLDAIRSEEAFQDQGRIEEGLLMGVRVVLATEVDEEAARPHLPVRRQVGRHVGLTDVDAIHGAAAAWQIDGDHRPHVRVDIGGHMELHLLREQAGPGCGGAIGIFEFRVTGEEQAVGTEGIRAISCGLPDAGQSDA